MAEMNYLDFELEISSGNGREYPVAVRSPAGEARATMRFPFDELALESRLKDLQIALLRSSGRSRYLLQPEEQAVQDFGKALFDALISGEIRNRYDVSLLQAMQRGTGLRLKLHTQTPELAAMPWEFLYDQRQAEYVCLSLITPLVRYLELPQVIQPLAVRPPLRLLGMTVNLPPPYELNIAREKQRVEEATQELRSRGLMELHWLPGQTWRDLQSAVQSGPWHIFHFIGHGKFDRDRGEGLIILADENESDQLYRLSATHLGRLLAGHHSLRLALLNSCEGGKSDKLDIFSSTAATLIRRGIPAVLAMQYEITDRAAIEFSRAFYEALAKAILPVDAAVVSARQAVSLALPNTVEWGTPVLYMRAPDGKIFDIQPVSDSDLRQARITFLLQEAKKEMEQENWQEAEEKINKVLTLDSTNADARILLRQLEQERDWASLYAKGIDRYETKRWHDALDCFHQIQAKRGNYKNLNALVEATKKEIRQDQIDALLREARETFNKKDWRTAFAKYQAVLELEPNHAQAKAGLNHARQEQELAEIYAQGMEHYEAKRWPDVLDRFRRIQNIRPHYRDVDNLVVAINKEIAKEDRITISPKPPTPPSERRRLRRSIVIASVVASAFALIILVFVFVSNRSEEPVSSVEQTSLSIFTTPADVLVILNGKDTLGFAPITAHQIQAGTISLYLEKPNYFSIGSTVVIEAGRDTSLSFTMERAAWWVSIKVDPSDAEVILNGEPVEPSRLDSLALPAGMHTINISRAGYEPLQKLFSMEQKDTTLVYSLQTENITGAPPIVLPRLGGLYITSEPSETVIVLDGQSSGTTPRTIPDLAPRNYTIILKKAGYEDYLISTKVVAGKTETVHAELIARKGILRVDIIPTPGSIYIDGVLKEASAISPYSISLPVGTHKVKMASLRGFLEKTVNIEADSLHELSIDFNKTGTLTVTAFDESNNPLRGSQIYVDGDYIPGRDTPMSFALHVGRHTITVRREGYTLIGEKQVIDLEDGREVRLKFILRKEL